MRCWWLLWILELAVIAKGRELIAGTLVVRDGRDGRGCAAIEAAAIG